MPPANQNPKTFLHIGPARRRGYQVLGFPASEWREVRLDIDPGANPDIVGSVTEMTAVPSGACDAVFSAHTIEHLYPDDVRRAFGEILRVLAPMGYVVLSCPDLEAAAKAIADGRALEPLYESGEGPITALDMVYSWRGYLSLPDRQGAMSHRTGFTLPILMESLRASGFPAVVGRRRVSSFEVWALASKSRRTEAELETLARTHFFR